ncbi:MAG: PadR family transcriptional regulator [Deltaproteobacteria bacterium]|nr:PadR family transcriptional regulator [Deltaproteobacteria bacterium]
MQKKLPYFGQQLTDEERQDVFRDIAFAFFKIRILKKALTQPISGRDLTQCIEEGGFKANPGTVYPLLKSLEKRGWLKSERRQRNYGVLGMKEFSLTAKGRSSLYHAIENMIVLYQELFGMPDEKVLKRRIDVLAEGMDPDRRQSSEYFGMAQWLKGIDQDPEDMS